MTTAGTDSTRLVVLRGNSGSGKSTTARALRERLGRGVAWIEQDYLRRIVLREHDRPDGVNIGLIDHTARYALDHGYHVILEGILAAERYGAMLRQLCRDHAGRSSWFYFDLSFDETIRRHATRPQARQFTVEDMRGWYRQRDLLGFVAEQIVSATSTLDQTVERIIDATGLIPAPEPPDLRVTHIPSLRDSP